MRIWQRPDSLEFPHVWHKFITNNQEEFHIADLKDEQIGNVLQHFSQFYCNDEPMLKSLDFINDQESMQEFLGVLKETFKQRLTIVCYPANDPSTIAGVLVSEIIANNPQKTEYRGKTMRHNYIGNKIIFDKANVFEKYQVNDLFMLDYLSVNPNYRYRGIGTKLLETTEEMCKTFGFKVRTGIFTAPGSERAAKKLQYTTDYEMSLDELPAEYRFPNITWNRGAIMSKCI